jgi:hypothetical protein
MDKLTTLELGRFMLWGFLMGMPIFLATLSEQIRQDSPDLGGFIFFVALACQVALSMACYFAGRNG